LTPCCDLDFGDSDLKDVSDTLSSHDTDIYEVSSNKILKLLAREALQWFELGPLAVALTLGYGHESGTLHTFYS